MNLKRACGDLTATIAGFCSALYRCMTKRGNIVRWYGTNTDIEDRKQAEEIRAAQARQASVRADVSAALSKPAHSREILRGCAEAIVRHLDAAFARIWTLNTDKNLLELQASAGMYTHLDGPHSHIPVGKLKIGVIAQEKKPHLTNDVLNDPWVSDKAWAQNEVMVSFAGYPLMVQDRVVGVMAMFARRRLSAATLDALASVADAIAQGIERKQTEEKIRQSEAYLAEAQRLSHTGSFGWNVTSGELFWSDQMYRILGVDQGAKPTLEMAFQRIHPEDIARVQETLDRGVQGGTDMDFENRFLLPDGSVKYVHVVALAVRDESMNLEYVGTVVDITASKRAEEALRQAQAELAHVTRVTTMGELTASIAHEVNQPLAAVIANANASLRWLAAATPNLDEAREALLRIVRDGKRASDVITRIRTLVQKTDPEKTRLDINQTVQEVVLLMHNEAVRKGVTLRIDLAADVPPVLGDRVQLQQVILNLVMNGIEAMNTVADRPREMVIRSSAQASDNVLLAVQDSGIGIDPRNLDKIFDTFYTTKPQGMGMGLAISRSIVENHGGKLWAVPNDGPGATFQFTLLKEDWTCFTHDR
jgi:PAS domain S-box-containing protein